MKVQFHFNNNCRIDTIDHCASRRIHIKRPFTYARGSKKYAFPLNIILRYLFLSTKDKNKYAEAIYGPWISLDFQESINISMDTKY